jgi:hypothetical protein
VNFANEDYTSPSAEGASSGDFDILTIPAVRSFVDRLASERGLEVEHRNFRKIALTEPTTDGYRRDRIVLTFGPAGEFKPWFAEPGKDDIELTEAEAAEIRAAFETISFPKSILASSAQSKRQQAARGVAQEDWFEFWNIERSGIVMVQQRIVDDATQKKSYLPWSYWSDGEWRRMEPDRDGLPLWKPPKRRDRARLMVHEGAKTARFLDALINDPEKRKERARHPWIADLASHEHWGWIGGAPNPHRTDWSEITGMQDITEVVIATDHDQLGEAAIAPISRFLKSSKAPVWQLRFDDRFIAGFDLADEMPPKLFKKDRWRGPGMLDLMRTATWATRQLPQTRPEFVGQWYLSIKPSTFVHYKNPSRLLDAAEFNGQVRPFSDVKDTADLIGRRPEAVVDGIAYEPGQSAGTVSVDGLLMVNTWRGTRIGRDPKGDQKPFLDFMEHLFPQKLDRDGVLRWCATLIACPQVRMRYGLLMFSAAQGVGKGTLAEKILAPLVGWHNTSVPSERMITASDFHSWLVRKRLAIIHEIYAGQSKKAYTSILSFITEDVLTINEKNVKEYDIRNWVHLVMCSNSRVALKLGKGDRRVFVPEVTEVRRPEAYWLALNAWLVRDRSRVGSPVRRQARRGHHRRSSADDGDEGGPDQGGALRGKSDGVRPRPGGGPRPRGEQPRPKGRRVLGPGRTRVDRREARVH